MSDEITEASAPSPETAPAVTELVPFEEAAKAEIAAATQWAELTDSQKLDILDRKLDAIGAQTTWIGSTLSGIIDMVGKVSPMDIFKMMRGGK